MIEEEFLIQRMTRRNVEAPFTIEIPNTTGDHLQAVKRNTPTQDTDLVNKKYVDDAIAGGISPLKIGDANTYVEVDTVNKKIVMFVDGVQVNEWS